MLNIIRKKPVSRHKLASFGELVILQSMNLKFTKMHGLGNDFIVIDGINQTFRPTTEQAQWLADRHFGVGCDQILIVEQSNQPNVDFKYRIMNADGSEVSQCGNGARCFARFVRRQGLSKQNKITVETNAGIMEFEIQADEQVTVNMGVPKFSPEDIPLLADKESLRYSTLIKNKPLEFAAVSLGNPHAVLLVDDVDNAAVESIGSVLESHELFPQRANVGFLQIITENHGKLRVFERGSGETLACGSGACAAAVVAQRWGLLTQNVVISLPGGDLKIQWHGEGTPVLMTGPAEFVFEGEVNIPVT